jgi:phenylalanyl-tRNA synthetase beta chain
MDILVPDNWLRKFVKTKASPSQIARYLSLSGPSVEKLAKTVYGPVYSIEVTTNRVDSASVYGIAREVSAILPRFNIKARLEPVKSSRLNLSPLTNYLKVKVDESLCYRFTAVLIKNVKIKPSPKWIADALYSVGERPINNVVDISNYIMHELGQPLHTFDYDKIAGKTMVLRASKKGETLTTLDGKTHTLMGGDIVIADGSGRLIDLAGIMGGANSAVDNNTKNVLLFVQTYNPSAIRQTSMSLSHRTEAAVLFEKGLDPVMVIPATARAIELFTMLTLGKVEKDVLDIYPSPYKKREITTTKHYIEDRLGVEIPKSEIINILSPLGFVCKWEKDKLISLVPSFRAGEVTVAEDIIEEIARIYGYHNFPSELMQGKIPDPLKDPPFPFEFKLKNILKGLGGVEVYTSSLVPKDYVEKDALRLKNPLGKDSEYLRTSLRPSLATAAKNNSGEKEPFHLFELSNVYLPKKGNLPEEKTVLAGIFANTEYRDAKGKIEALLNLINVKASVEPTDIIHFLPNRAISIKVGAKEIGILGVLREADYIYYEFGVSDLKSVSSEFSSYEPIPKYPAQIEDTTFILPGRTKVGDVLNKIRTVSSLIRKVELTDIYKDAFTFKVWYQDPKKTLTDKETRNIRDFLIKSVKKSFGATVK